MKILKQYVYELDGNCGIVGFAELVGEKEKQGVFGRFFRDSITDDKMGEKTFEKGERRMLDRVCEMSLKRAGLSANDINLFLGGDLMNQIVSTNYVAEHLQIPFVGIYSACSTLTASLGIGSLLVEGGKNLNILCSAISHFSSAERQYRFPLEFGNQRQCYSQWTVTAGGAFVLSYKKSDIITSKVCFGRVQDYGVCDIANMGAAMAPAACDTLCMFFRETNTKPQDYDLIATGDLGKLGSDILRDLIEKEGFCLSQEYMDCGHSIYSFDEESYQGGSGAGCSAAVLSGYILKQMKEGKFKKVLVVATGALMSTVTNQQGDAIPSVAHLIELKKI
jgi:stage V sporulation protein AD